MIALADQIDSTDIPPTWTGTFPSSITQFSNPNFGLRYSVGQDAQTYQMWQREQGDLFLRDCVLQDQIQRLIDCLELRWGTPMSVANVIVPASSQVMIGQIDLGEDVYGAYGVKGALSNVALNGATSAEVSLTVYLMSSGSPTGGALYSWTAATTADNQWAVPADWDFSEREPSRPTLLAGGGKSYGVFLTNNDATYDISCSAYFAYAVTAASE